MTHIPAVGNFIMIENYTLLHLRDFRHQLCVSVLKSIFQENYFIETRKEKKKTLCSGRRNALTQLYKVIIMTHSTCGLPLLSRSNYFLL